MFRKTPLIYQQVSRDELIYYRNNVVGFVDSDGDIIQAEKIPGFVMYDNVCYGMRKPERDLYKIELEHIDTENRERTWKPFVLASSSNIITPLQDNFGAIDPNTVDCFLTDKVFLYSMLIPTKKKIISGLEVNDLPVYKKYEVRNVIHQMNCFEISNELPILPTKLIVHDNKICGFFVYYGNHAMYPNQSIFLFRDELDFSNCGELMDPEASIKLYIDPNTRPARVKTKTIDIKTDSSDSYLRINLKTSQLQINPKSQILYIPSFCLESEIIKQ